MKKQTRYTLIFGVLSMGVLSIGLLSSWALADQAFTEERVPLQIASGVATPAVSDCTLQIKDFTEHNPPISYVGKPGAKPDPNWVALKVATARFMYDVLSGYSDPTCQQLVIEACWEYCGAGIERGALELHCISQACR